MIARVLDAVGQRVDGAEIWTAADETLTVALGEDHRLAEASSAVSVQLRIHAGGRVGAAAGHDDAVDPLIETAFASAAQGPETPLHLPGPAPMPSVQTAWPASAALDTPALFRMAQILRERLLRDGRQVSTWAERSVGRIGVGNSRGVQAGYDVTLVGVGLHIRADGPTGPLELRLHHAGAEPPSAAVFDRLGAAAEERLAVREVEPAAGLTGEVVWLGPRAVRALLTPITQALHADHLHRPGAAGPARPGEPLLPEWFTLVDDPLRPGRPGSRPVDDEGVVCRTQRLIDRGVVAGWLADLATAERLGLPASGQTWREGMDPPRAGWSNLVLEPGAATRDELAALAADGILIRDLPVPTGDCTDGRVSLTTPWAWRLRGGEPVARLARLTLRGNVYEMLARVLAVGDTLAWWGAAGMPDLVFTPPWPADT